MAKESKIRIVLTGGHAATTAISVVEEIIRRKSAWEIYWIGVEGAIEGEKVVTLESEALPKLGVHFQPIRAGRIQRKFTLRTIPALVKIPFGFFQAFLLINKIKPRVVLSFGGFAAFPVVIAAWIMRIPIIIHEQTAVAGRANRASAAFARKIALSRETSRKFFPAAKSVVVGNPILTQVKGVGPKKTISAPPVVFVTGGSRGSLVINDCVFEVLTKLVSKYRVIHLTGPMDFEKFKTAREKLSAELKVNYEVYSRIDPLQIDNVYADSDIIVGRAGANTVSEIIATKRPAVLIPIPFSYLNEQSVNARFAQDYGLAVVINQNEFTGGALLAALRKIEKDWKKIVDKVENKKGPDAAASGKLVDILERSLV